MKTGRCQFLTKDLLVSNRVEDNPQSLENEPGYEEHRDGSIILEFN